MKLSAVQPTLNIKAIVSFFCLRKWSLQFLSTHSLSITYSTTAERLSDKNRLATFVGLLLLQVHVYLGSLRVPKKKQENKFSSKSPQPQRHVHTISHLASASSKGFFYIFFLSARSSWETGSEQEVATGGWKRMRSALFLTHLLIIILSATIWRVTGDKADIIICLARHDGRSILVILFNF